MTSLCELGAVVPALRPLMAPYAESASAQSSPYIVGRFRRHLVKELRVDAADAALFDVFPDADRRAMLRAIGEELAARQQRRKEAVARLHRYRQSVAAARERALSDGDRARITSAATWAVELLGAEEACWIVEDAFYAPTLEVVRLFCSRKEATFAEFERRVRRRAAQLYGASETSGRRTALAALAALGLEQDAGEEAIRRRYRALAKRHHPDLGGRPERMAEINAAYDLLVGSR